MEHIRLLRNNISHLAEGRLATTCGLSAPPPPPLTSLPTSPSTAPATRYKSKEKEHEHSPESTQLVIRRPSVGRVEAAAEVVVEVRADLVVGEQVRVDPGEVAEDGGARDTRDDACEREPVAGALPTILCRCPRLILRAQFLRDPREKRG